MFHGGRKNMFKKQFVSVGVCVLLVGTMFFGLVGVVGADAPPTPGVPKGPTFCNIDVEYQYRVGSVPSDGSTEYFFDWGDGTTDSWVGPWTTHVWTEYGRYEIRIKARNATTLEESDWSEPLEVVVDPLEIVGVSGGTSIGVAVKNSGGLGKLVNWRVELVGGTFPGFHLNKIFESSNESRHSDTRLHLDPGETGIITVNPTLALGRFKIKVSVDCAGYPYKIEDTFDAIILFFYVLLN